MAKRGWGTIAVTGIAAAVSFYAIAQAQGWTGGNAARTTPPIERNSDRVPPVRDANQTSSATCRVPAELATPNAVPPPAGQVRRTPTTRYTLALSWSPGHCARRDWNNYEDDVQCSGQAGSFGFVLHGLWPETDGRNWPQYCAPTRVISSATIREHLCMTPSPQLMQHEWAKHGSCMARTPEAYFERAASLYDRVVMPDMTRFGGRRDMTAGDLRAAFMAANPGLARSAVQININRGGWLEEVHLCLDRRFRYAACPAWQSGAGDDARIRVEPQR